ncbi:MAG: DUF1298 domain-containing protein [Acidimicrobiia bacterium]|nr:DUF1298 domain-containing protein [Acidimicrobiia bacterium]
MTDMTASRPSRERMGIMDVPFWDYGFGNNRQIGGIVYVLGGQPAVDDVRARVRTLLDWSPRLRQHVEESWGHIRAPFWVEDSDFDLDSHFHHVQLDGIGLPEFLDKYSRRYEIPLDSRRPLWEVWYYTGVEGGSCLVLKMHHSIYDGLVFAQISRILSDTPPSLDEAKRKIAQIRARTASARREDRTGSTGTESGMSKLSRVLVDQAARLRRQGESIWPEPLGHSRQISATSLPMTTVRAIQKRTRTSLTAVYQTFWSMAVQAMHGGLDREIAVSLPMSMRHLTQPVHPLDLDSRQTSTPFLIPYQISDPGTRLAEIDRRLGELKARRVQIFAAAQIARHAPRQVLKRAVVAKIRLTNMVASSVPGPKKPLDMLGHRVSNLYMHTMPVPHNPLVAGFVNYGPQLEVTLTADPDIIPWVEKMPGAVATALDALDAATSQ